MDERQTGREPADAADRLSGGSGSVSRSPAGPERATGVRRLATLGNDARYEALRLAVEVDDGACAREPESIPGVSQGAVSRVPSRLFGAGPVERREEGRWRYYTATPRAERLFHVSTPRGPPARSDTAPARDPDDGRPTAVGARDVGLPSVPTGLAPTDTAERTN